MKKHSKRRGFLQFALPALGLLLNMEQSRKQNNMQNRALDAQSRGVALEEDKYNTFSRPALERLMGIAEAYDPVAESRAGVQAAERSATDAIGRALRQYDVSYRAGGGSPGQTTMYSARQSATMRPIAQRLGDIVADAMSNQSVRKAQMWQSVLGQAPAGNLSQAYFQSADNLAQMAGRTPGGDFGGVSRLLADMLGQQRPGGAGGRGDNRWPSGTPPFNPNGGTIMGGPGNGYGDWA